MSFRIFPPQKFGKTTEQDAFAVAVAWLDQLEIDGWVPACDVIVSGTSGFVILLGPQRTNLLFRRVGPMDSRESMTEPAIPAATKKRASR